MKGGIDQKYIQRWRNRLSLQKLEQKQRAQEARRTLDPMIRVLTCEFGATQIILFGSLVRGGFHQTSDIDLAVAGIEPGSFYQALAAVNNISSRWVDLKPLESLSPHFYQRVIETGEELYARDQS